MNGPIAAAPEYRESLIASIKHYLQKNPAAKRFKKIELYLFDSIDSTMTVAKTIAKGQTDQLPQSASVELNKEGKETLFLILAREQLAGRGRKERSWVSKKDSGLYFTLLWRAGCSSQQLQGFSLAVAVALRKALQLVGCAVGLKWPNDLVVVDKKTNHLNKLGGILIELITGRNDELYVSTGIGVNLLPQEVDGPLVIPVSVQQLLGRIVSAGEVIAPMVVELSRMIDSFCEQGFKSFMQSWLEGAVIISRKVRAIRDVEVFSGTAIGITEEGALRIKLLSGEIVEFVTGDVSLVVE